MTITLGPNAKMEVTAVDGDYDNLYNALSFLSGALHSKSIKYWEISNELMSNRYYEAANAFDEVMDSIAELRKDD